MRALIIKEPWISLIFQGKKTWELRTTNTRIRETIGLIRKGSGLVVGTARLVDVVALPEKLMKRYNRKHRTPKEHFGNTAKTLYAWVLEDIKAFPKPIPYKHPSGAIIWVRISST